MEELPNIYLERGLDEGLARPMGVTALVGYLFGVKTN